MRLWSSAFLDSCKISLSLVLAWPCGDIVSHNIIATIQAYPFEKRKDTFGICDTAPRTVESADNGYKRIAEKSEVNWTLQFSVQKDLNKFISINLLYGLYDRRTELKKLYLPRERLLLMFARLLGFAKKALNIVWWQQSKLKLTDRGEIRIVMKRLVLQSAVDLYHWS